jgi:hypothetical protein
LNQNTGAQSAEPNKAGEQGAKRVFASPASNVPATAEIAKRSNRGKQDRGQGDQDGSRPADGGKDKDKRAN